MTEQTLEWIRVGHVDDLPEGRVKTVTARNVSICLAHFDGQWAAMDNHCPHQGGPLGEGSIEDGVDGKCWIRCPWHGWDFDPLTGLPPGGHKDTGQTLYPVEVREKDVFVGLEPEPERERTVTDAMTETTRVHDATCGEGRKGFELKTFHDKDLQDARFPPRPSDDHAKPTFRSEQDTIGDPDNYAGRSRKWPNR